ncbi:MAG: tetratricopeptide repeat protein [Candidatus Methanoplasma sp.]|jgi:hypothetical protein|nr:tetratricopeptide repeat protein [Candidatus Methanoplasma sp.]
MVLIEGLLGFIVGEVCEKVNDHFLESTIKKELEKCYNNNLACVPHLDSRLERYFTDKENKKRNIAIILSNQDPLSKICPNEFTEDEKEELNSSLLRFVECILKNDKIKEIIGPDVIISTAKEIADIRADVKKILKEVEQTSARARIEAINNIPRPKTGFTGRAKEIEDIAKALKEEGSAVVHGIGGIGKTEICLRYANPREDNVEGTDKSSGTHTESQIYHNKVLIYYDGESLKSSFVNTEIFAGIVNSDDNDDAKYNSILMFLKRNPSLIIVDNFNTENDLHMQNLICDPLKTIFVSRNIIKGLRSVEIHELADAEQMGLFRKEYLGEDSRGDSSKSKVLKDESIIWEILKEIDGHTMTIVLVANLLREDILLTPKDVLNNLKKHSIKEIAGEVDITKDGKRRYDKIYKHIEGLFEMSTLTEDEKYVLMNLSVMQFPTDAHLFIEMLESKDDSETRDRYNGLISKLIKRGWIRRTDLEDGKKLLTMHTLISYVVEDTTKPDAEKCAVMVENVFKFIQKLNPRERERSFSLLSMGESCLKLPNDEKQKLQLTLMTARGFGELHSYSKRLTHETDALHFKIKLFGEDNPATATSYNNIGGIHDSMGDLQKALEMYEKSLSGMLKIYGKEDQRVKELQNLCNSLCNKLKSSDSV